jgi:hypothetical protein
MMMMKKTNKPNAGPALVLSLAALSVAFGLLLSVAVPREAYAWQRSVTPKERVVDGKVVNKAESPLPGAVVYLKDTKSLSVKTFICDDAGHFHFGQLSQNTDYELSAVSNGVKSNTKSISSFDDKNSYYFTLTVK